MRTKLQAPMHSGSSGIRGPWGHRDDLSTYIHVLHHTVMEQLILDRTAHTLP